MCKVSLIFVAPYDADTRAVNLATGRHGYGHVAMWAGHLDSAERPVLFDAGMGWGVGFRPLAIATGGAPFHTLELDEHLSSWIWSRAVRFAGCSYDYRGLAFGQRTCERFTCSGLVAHCLPMHLRSELPRRCSPNDLARYFGVPKRG